MGPRLVSESLISNTPVQRSDNDQLMSAERNYIRHDSEKVAKLILGILDD